MKTELFSSFDNKKPPGNPVHISCPLHFKLKNAASVRTYISDTTSRSIRNILFLSPSMTNIHFRIFLRVFSHGITNILRKSRLSSPVVSCTHLTDEPKRRWHRYREPVISARKTESVVVSLAIASNLSQTIITATYICALRQKRKPDISSTIMDPFVFPNWQYPGYVFTIVIRHPRFACMPPLYCPVNRRRSNFRDGGNRAYLVLRID